MSERFTVADLIGKLKELDQDWLIAGTKAGNLIFWEGEYWEKGKRYGYVFVDHKPTKIMTVRHSAD